MINWNGDWVRRKQVLHYQIKLKAFPVIILAAWPFLYGQVPPCFDFECDRAVVQQILDINGVDTVTVDNVSYQENGRIIGINISRLGIKILPPELGRLTMLNDFQAAFNQLTEIPPEFGQLRNLRRFALPYNLLTSVLPEIGQLDELEFLFFSGNRISSLPDISNLNKVNSVYLADNQFTEFPSQLFGLKGLNHIDLGGNRLSSLPNQITSMRSLTVLKLNNNLFTLFPVEILMLNQLSTLSLSANFFSEIPPQIAVLTSLKILELNEMGLTDLPYEFAQLTNMTKLELRSNKFESLPLSVCRLTHLNMLFLDNNRLTRLPPEFSQLTALWELTAAFNAISELPPEMGQMNNLHDMDLSHNLLADLPPEIEGMGLTRIHNLDGTITYGSSIESNRLCEVAPSTADWLDANFGDWRASQKMDDSHYCDGSEINRPEKPPVKDLTIQRDTFSRTVTFISGSTGFGSLSLYSATGSLIKHFKNSGERLTWSAPGKDQDIFFLKAVIQGKVYSGRFTI